jgi:hypothetical protein
MSKKQKLELTWIGKDKRPRLEPRILLEDKELSYRADVPMHRLLLHKRKFRLPAKTAFRLSFRTIIC